MKVYVVLNGPGGQLDGQMIEMPDGEMTFRELADRFDWIVKPGDTIRIEEVD